jgi:hypothetical protein
MLPIFTPPNAVALRLGARAAARDGPRRRPARRGRRRGHLAVAPAPLPAPGNRVSPTTPPADHRGAASPAPRTEGKTIRWAPALRPRHDAPVFRVARGLAPDDRRARPDPAGRANPRRGLWSRAACRSRGHRGRPRGRDLRDRPRLRDDRAGAPRGRPGRRAGALRGRGDRSPSHSPTTFGRRWRPSGSETGCPAVPWNSFMAWRRGGSDAPPAVME